MRCSSLGLQGNTKDATHASQDNDSKTAPLADCDGQPVGRVRATRGFGRDEIQFANTKAYLFSLRRPLFENMAGDALCDFRFVQI